MKENDKITMYVKMEVKPAQALALQAMFGYWNQLSGLGGSRKVGFYVDGDGDFHPNVQISFDPGIPVELPELTPELREAAIIEDNDGDRTYDYDPVAWRLYHPQPEKKNET